MSSERQFLKDKELMENIREFLNLCVKAVDVKKGLELVKKIAKAHDYTRDTPPEYRKGDNTIKWFNDAWYWLYNAELFDCHIVETKEVLIDEFKFLYQHKLYETQADFIVRRLCKLNNCQRIGYPRLVVGTIIKDWFNETYYWLDRHHYLDYDY